MKDQSVRATFRFPVRGRGQRGVLVKAGLLDEAWAMIRQAIPNVDALMEGAPVRVDESVEPRKPVRLSECVGSHSGSSVTPTPDV